MKLFSEFAARSPNRVFCSVALGALSGVSYSLLIPLVLSAIKPDDPRLHATSVANPNIFGFEIAHAPFAAVFAAVCLFILLARSASQIMLTRLAIDVASDLRTRMYNRIAAAPLPVLERIGSPRMLAALTTDIPRIILGARLLPDLVVDLVMLVGMLGFLLILNPSVFTYVMACIAFGAATYQVPMLVGRRHFRNARQGFDDLQASMEGLIRGIKELKLNDWKRDAFFREVLLAHEARVRTSEKAGHTLVRAATNYGDLISFFVIGTIIFVLVNYRSIASDELVGIIMALLYITGPVAIVLNAIPQLSVAQVSLRRFGALFAQLPGEDLGTRQETVLPWQEIRFEGVEYQHTGAEGPGFRLGPIDLTLRKGEITFIVGGNGSGKSTLSKLITLHYVATAGVIRFGAQEVDSSSIGTLRQSIAAIYSDYHLFDRVLGLNGRHEVQSTVEHYLEALQLAHKVTFRDGFFSTLSLSDGQRRRLALLVALLDDKDLYLFDEWAADQDPSFKQVFYHEILPELKRRGKAIVAISHDDRYFDVADQVITLEDGHTNAHAANAGASMPPPRDRSRIRAVTTVSQGTAIDSCHSPSQ